MDDKMRKRIQELVEEKISIVSYNSIWPKMFEDEAAFLRRKLPPVQHLVMMAHRTTLGLSNEIQKVSARTIFIYLNQIQNYGTDFILEIFFGNFLRSQNNTTN